MAESYAKPDSLQFISHYVQRRRKKRKSSLPALVQRYFTDLTAAGGQYYSISDPITLTGDFEIEVDAMQTAAAIDIALSKDSVTDEFIAFRLSGEIRVNIGGVIIDSPVSVIEYQKIHRVKVTRIGTLVTLYLDGVQMATGNTSNSFTIDTVGKYNSGSYWDGVLANLKITDGSTLVADFPLDEDWVIDNIAHNRANPANNATAINITSADAERFTQDSNGDWLGVELIVNGSFDTDSDWTKGIGWSISGGQAIQSGTPTPELLYQSVSRPDVYRLAVDVESISVDRIRFYDGVAYAHEVDQAGSYSFDVINQDTNYNFFTIRSDINTIANINSVSAKRLLQQAS